MTLPEDSSRMRGASSWTRRWSRRPVVPDSPRWCRTCQGYGDHHTDGHPPEAVPDSTDVANVLDPGRYLLTIEDGRSRIEPVPDSPDALRQKVIDALVMSPLADTAGTDLAPFERTADAVLAVVGQGVTAESAHACPPGEVIEKFDGGRNALLCGSCRWVVGYRAVVGEGVSAECDHARAARDLVRSYPGSLADAAALVEAFAQADRAAVRPTGQEQADG